MEHEDIINRPSHYTQYDIEPITFIMTNKLAFHVGNIVKYAVRAGSKSYPNQTPQQSEITDLRKAMRYCEMRINQLESQDEL